MKNSTMVVWTRLKKMPGMLHTMTIAFWIGGTFTAIASVLPGWKDQAGRLIGIREFWSQGMGLGVLSTGIGLILLGSLIYSGRSWVRHLLLIGIIVITSYELMRGYDLDSISLILSILVVCVAIWYLYFRRCVVSYFSGNKYSAEQ